MAGTTDWALIEGQLAALLEGTDVWVSALANASALLMDALEETGLTPADPGFYPAARSSVVDLGIVRRRKIDVVADRGKAAKICENLCRKFTDDEEYIQKELKNALPRVLCLELAIDHMTGKLVSES